MRFDCEETNENTTGLIESSYDVDELALSIPISCISKEQKSKCMGKIHDKLNINLVLII